MSERNKAIARQVFEDVQSQGKDALVDRLVTRDYVGHTPIGEIHGPQGAKEFNALLRGAFPDFDVTVEDQIAEGDTVATRWRACGTHNGPFQGIAPTGKEIEFTGMTIFRCADGKLVEGWTNPDLLGLMQQIGRGADGQQS